MLGISKIRWPTFSLTGLFWFATAVTIGFAVSKTTVEEPVNTLFGLQERAIYSPTLIAIGAVLVVYELVRQAVLLRQSHTDLQEYRTAMQLAIGLRWALALGIVAALVTTQLINRKFLVLHEPEDMLQFYGELWPAMILILLLFVSMRLMTNNVQNSQTLKLRQTVAVYIVGLGMVLIFVYMITDRNTINFLVHVATAGVENSHAMRWQRIGAFPNHAAEGFQTFWTSWRMACAMGVAGLGLILTTQTSRKWLAACLWLVFLAAVVQGFRYASWFVMEDFARINPDLANQHLPATKRDLACGLTIAVGLAWVLGDRLAKCGMRARRTQETARIELPKVSGLVAIGALLIALGCGSDFVRTCCDLFSLPAGWFVTNSSWLNNLASFAQVLAYPEEIIPLGAALAGLRIVWQYYRDTDQTAYLQPSNLPRTLTYSAAVLLWLFAAVPTFAIFGFCYWLGPWVL